MGLGKTLTILSLIAQNPEESTLVVAPLSVLHQWQNEIEAHTDNIRYYIYHGKSRSFKSEFNRARVVLTTYATLLSDV